MRIFANKYFCSQFIFDQATSNPHDKTNRDSARKKEYVAEIKLAFELKVHRTIKIAPNMI